MSGRLGGGSRKPINECADITKLHFHKLPDMATAVRLSRRQFWASVTDKDRAGIQSIGNRPVTGDAVRLKQAMAKADELVESAIACDPRLARKAEWKRRDEGEHVCAALLAEGDDAPFYKRTRNVVNDATLAGDPLKVVISTDDRHVPPDTAAAFIATARIVQQFVPLQIWWQGAWLTDDKWKGFVFQVPLVAGDMDFSRLEFCIADRFRDSFSYLVMATHAVLDIRESWNDCGHRAEWAYKPDGNIDWSATTKFVSHHGISPADYSVASTAAQWLGWESVSSVEWNIIVNNTSAGQSIPKPASTSEYKVSEADRARWKREDEERMRKARKEASNRLAA